MFFKMFALVLPLMMLFAQPAQAHSQWKRGHAKHYERYHHRHHPQICRYGHQHHAQYKHCYVYPKKGRHYLKARPPKGIDVTIVF